MLLTAPVQSEILSDTPYQKIVVLEDANVMQFSINAGYDLSIDAGVLLEADATNVLSYEHELLTETSCEPTADNALTDTGDRMWVWCGDAASSYLSKNDKAGYRCGKTAFNSYLNRANRPSFIQESSRFMQRV
jgi:hypothetical protein